MPKVKCSQAGWIPASSNDEGQQLISECYNIFQTRPQMQHAACKGTMMQTLHSNSHDMILLPASICLSGGCGKEISEPMPSSQEVSPCAGNPSDRKGLMASVFS